MLAYLILKQSYSNVPNKRTYFNKHTYWNFLQNTITIPTQITVPTRRSELLLNLSVQVFLKITITEVFLI